MIRRKRRKPKTADELAFVKAIRDRCQGRCERCTRYVGQALHSHHIIPRSLGGTNALDNGAGMCFICHRAVHDHTVPDWRNWIKRNPLTCTKASTTIFPGKTTIESTPSTPPDF